MPEGRNSRAVGARLREAREKRGVSLRQIANNTRISVMSLEALERSDLSRLPGGIFTRAFIRAYAQEVGLDPDRTIQDFIAELPREAASAASGPLAEDSQKFESDRKAAATAIRLVLLSIPLAGAVIYYGARGVPESSDSEVVAADKTSVSSTAQVPLAAPARSEAVDRADQQVPAKAEAQTGLTLEISPKAACWVSVTADGEPRFSAMMHAGDRQVISAKEQILLNVGDAGAFAYTLNGREGRTLGSPGQVVRRRITRSNLQDYLNP